MIRIFYFIVVLILSFFGWWSLASAKELPSRNSSVVANSKNKWGSAIWNGKSFFAEKLFQNTNTTIGPIANGIVLYNIDEYWNLGIMTERQQHIITAPGREVDKFKSLSILPVLEFHYTAGRLSPYMNFGAGINFNTFDDDETVATLCGVIGVGSCDFSPVDTITARVGVGTDFFVSDQLAINIEGAWRRNSGDVSLKIADVTGATQSFTRDSAEALIGFRYYFSPCVQC